MENKIKKVLRETLKRFLVEETSDTEISIKTIQDKSEMTQYLEDVWEIFELSYKDIGGFKSAHNPKNFPNIF